MPKLNPAVKAHAFFTRAMMAFVFLMISVFTFAQEKKVDVDIDVNKGGGFFSTPWVWVVGAAVFILLLVALLRGNSRKGA